jgi:hypothetical protein
MAVLKTARISFFLSFLILLVFRSPAQGPDPSLGGQMETASARRALASLRKVSDYPLYVMEFRGDYGFAEYLKTGERQPSPLGSRASGNPPAFPWACTCFSALGNSEKPLLGRNFDWYDDVPLVLFTRPDKGYASVSIVDLRYFGFNRKRLPDGDGDQSRLLQTPFAPFDGMNEKGVAVGMMAVPSAEPPFIPDRVTIGELQVIRLILDYAASVDEAVELVSRYNVRIQDPPIHYFIVDTNGRSVILEFVDRKMIVLSNTEPWQVSTNFIVHGTKAPRGVSCWRYNRAYRALQKSAGDLSNGKAMELLRDVSQANTIWSVVYDLAGGGISIVPGKRFDEVLDFNLSQMTKRTEDRHDNEYFPFPE